MIVVDDLLAAKLEDGIAEDLQNLLAIYQAGCASASSFKERIWKQAAAQRM
jgi:hypothetical protein